jgi:hypothetical protein
MFYPARYSAFETLVGDEGTARSALVHGILKHHIHGIGVVLIFTVN